MTRIQLMPKFTAVTVIIVGIIVLLGWALGIEQLKRGLPGLVAMNPTTAVAFMLAGFALWLLQRSESRLPWRRLAQGCASIVATVGLLKLCALLGGPDARVDQWLFSSKLDPTAFGNATGGTHGTLPNRMAPNTALNFLLLGGALLLLDTRKWRGVYPSQVCSVVIVLTAWLALIGYVFNSGTFYQVGSFIPMVGTYPAACCVFLRALCAPCP